MISEFKELLFLIFGCLLTLSLSASENNPTNSIFDLMNHREVLELTLEADFGHLKTHRREDVSHPARLQFVDAQGVPQDWELKVKVRGAFRRTHCADVPPLKLNFKKSDLEAAGLATFDDLKLVSQCVSDEEAAKDLLLREYLAYKMYNELSDYSFRVQLLRITYLDSKTGEKSRQYAFLIEDTAQLRERFGADKADENAVYNLPADRFYHEQLKIVAVFQYLIGNTDWNIANCKNLKLLDKGGKYIPVPYDFDFSGMVNAPYTTINSRLGQTSRRERIFLGYPEDVEDLHTATAILLGHRAKFDEMVRGFKLLSADSRQDIRKYLNSYYDSSEVMKVGEPMVVGE